MSLPHRLPGALVLAAGLGLAGVLPAKAIAQETPPVDLADGWSRLVASDDADRSAPELDDALWPVTSLTASWGEQGLTGATATLWYRKRVRVPPGLAGPGSRPALFIGAFAYGSYQVFADGALVGAYGELGGPAPFPRNRVVELPRGVVADGEVVLALRVSPTAWADDVAGAERAVFPGAYLAAADRLETAASLLAHQEREGTLGQLVFAVIALAVGVFHLFLFWGRLSQREYLWFGAACLAFAVNTLSVSPWTAPAFLTFSAPYRLSSASGHAATALLLLFLFEIFGRRRRDLVNAYVLSHLALGLLVLVVPMAWAVSTASARFMWLFPGLALAVVVLALELRDGHPDARSLALGAGAIALAEGAEFLRLSGAPLPIFLPDAGFILAIFAVAAMLAGRYARQMAALDALRLTLESRVEERTAALAEAMERAHVANEAKSRFLTNMSHELRTPLNAVIGFANVLLKRAQATRGVLSTRELDFLERIRSNGMHLLALVDRVLDLSVIEAGSVHLESRPVDLALLVNRVLADMSPQAEERGIRLSSVVPAKALPVTTDPVRLRQVLTNLVDNAIKFTPKGTVTVTVTMGAGGPRSIEVQDTGVGIPPDHLARVMDAFSPADDSAARSHHGMGLGLAITRALCALLGFRLTLESEEGVGTKAVVDLQPEAAALAGAPGGAPSRASSPTPGARMPSPASRLPDATRASPDPPAQ
ncbi:MAG: hypothetical protein AMXMBFR53_07420 [Gemmatimonadota bacterium]